MNEKLSLYNIAELLAEKTDVETAEIEKFIIELITLVNEGIRKDGIVKVKGFGTFKIILVKERESVHINTGERIIIPAHHKLSFKPEEELKELINKPFSIFETIEATDENLKKNSDLSLSETKEDVNDTELTNSQSLISDYKIVDDESEQNSSEVEKEEVDIIPPPIEETSDMNQEEDALPVNENEENTFPSQEDKPITNVNNTSGSEDGDTSLQADNDQKEEIITPPMPSQQPVKSKKSPDKKKKSKSSSLMPLYLVLILLLFILAGCIWYYFAYSRSFDSFDKEYSTKVTNNTFVLPGDSVSEQQALEKAKILSKDSISNATNPGTSSSDPNSQSLDGSPANSETVTSKPADKPATSPSKPAAATTTKKPSTTESNNTKPAASNNTSKVLAKVKMESGNRLTLVAEKYYGNKLFWVYIYDFNKEKIGSNPDNIRAGMEIQVPTKETYGIDANNADSVEKARKLQSQLMAGKK